MLLLPRYSLRSVAAAGPSHFAAMLFASTDCWWSPFRKIGNITVISADLTPGPARESQALAWLSEDEWSRWIKYRYAGPRRQFALCRAALRAILCNRLGCTNEQLAFGSSGYGKPYALVDGSAAAVSFNVSHSGRQGMIAIAPESRLGVDVEEHISRTDFDELGAAVFSPDEQAELSAARGEYKLRLFFDLWTIKEALIKALGTGLYLNPSGFEVPQSMRHGDKTAVFRFPHVPGTQWGLANLGGEDFAAAVAWEIKAAPSAMAGQGRVGC